MDSQRILRDVLFFSKASFSNQIAKYAPALYVKLTGQTGRGGDENTIEIADYFVECFQDYFFHLGIADNEIPSFLQDKIVLEYGPGDILGVALLFYAYGAKEIHCVDRFSLSKLSEKNMGVYRKLLERLKDKQRERAETAFNIKGKPESGLNEKCIYYQVTEDGLAGVSQRYDFIISRAVLEHVNDLEKTMLDIKHSLKLNGTSLHQVDLKSHGLDRDDEFDFLTWPDFLYRVHSETLNS